MQAVVLRRPRTLELVDVPVPALTAPEHVLVKVAACGICGSDLRYWAGENPWALHTVGRHIDNPPNIILGHEFAGTVVKVNAPAYEPLLGCRVGVQPYRVCGACAFCRSGRHNLCRETIHIGHGQGWGAMDFFPGGYAEYCLAWGDLVYPMPDPVSFEECAMADIFGVAVHVSGRGRLADGADVLCIGGGPVGLSVALVAKAKGARRVFVSETSATARAVLARYDVTVIDPSSVPIAQVLEEATGRPAVAAIFDSVGNRATLHEALGLLQEGGTYVNLAVHDTPLELNAAALGSERTITTSSNAFYSDVREAYDLIFSGRVAAGPMITDRFPVAEYQQAFDRLLSTPKQAYKAVLLP